MVTATRGGRELDVDQSGAVELVEFAVNGHHFKQAANAALEADVEVSRERRRERHGRSIHLHPEDRSSQDDDGG